MGRIMAGPLADQGWSVPASGPVKLEWRIKEPRSAPKAQWHSRDRPLR